MGCMSAVTPGMTDAVSFSSSDSAATTLLDPRVFCRELDLLRQKRMIMEPKINAVMNIPNKTPRIIPYKAALPAFLALISPLMAVV